MRGLRVIAALLLGGTVMATSDLRAEQQQQTSPGCAKIVAVLDQGGGGLSAEEIAKRTSTVIETVRNCTDWRRHICCPPGHRRRFDKPARRLPACTCRSARGSYVADRWASGCRRQLRRTHVRALIAPAPGPWRSHICWPLGHRRCFDKPARRLPACTCLSARGSYVADRWASDCRPPAGPYTYPRSHYTSCRPCSRCRRSRATRRLGQSVL